MLKLYTMSSLILLPYDFFPPQGLNISSPPPGFDVRRVDKVGGRPLPPLLVVGPTREGTWDPQKLNFFLGTNFFFGIFEKFVPKVPKVWEAKIFGPAVCVGHLYRGCPFVETCPAPSNRSLHTGEVLKEIQGNGLVVKSSPFKKCSRSATVCSNSQFWCF